VNTPGSFSCSCQTGYYRPIATQDCTVCPPFFYGEFCSQSCACTSANAKTCNHVNGTCSCTAQWKGTNCSIDVDECQDKTYTCPSNSYCTNLNGGYTCTCASGYFKNVSNNTCQTCACNMSRTMSCDPTSGKCSCKSGWQGSTCNEDVNECLDPNKYNCPPNSSCNNTLGGYECLCLQGYYKNIITSKCEECLEGYYGNNCSNSCSCNSTNSNCIKTTGVCMCHSGWTGSTCNQDINECAANASICNTSKNEVCSNIPGSYSCDCLPGYYRDTDSYCTSNFCLY
uniref:EGF-like domain-containing protein n=1 Tax=Biomphalaria glabrata TaxID=6526 RepID=A0A2C9KEE2_BIOGL